MWGEVSDRWDKKGCGLESVGGILRSRSEGYEVTSDGRGKKETYVLTGSCYRLIKEEVADMTSEFIEKFLVKVSKKIRFVIGRFMALPGTMIFEGRG